MNRTIVIALLFIVTVGVAAQEKSLSLHDEILQQDTAMFDAFNAHQLDKVAAYFDDGLEFYHDQGGLSGKRESLAGIKGMFDQNNGMRRDLVPGTFEVYPIKDYGAIEIGAHRFCHQENGKDDCGVFKFLHVWQKQHGGWRITRVISYGH
jgi:ketosteroid isomerase-like protein